MTDNLQREMNQGKMNVIPLPFVFYSFYSLLTVPFLTKNLCVSSFMNEDLTFADAFVEWKSYIIMQMENL